MRHNGAENAGDISSYEGDAQLLRLVALISGLGYDVLIKSLDSLFETGKLHHRVRDLPHPERRQAFVESPQSLGLHDDGHGGPEGFWEPGLGLDADFDSLERRESDVGEELGRGGGDEVERRPVEIGVLFADGVAVKDFEQLVETEFTQTLDRVAHQRRGPSEGQGSHATLGDRDFESIDDSLVFGWIDLNSALDQI